MLDEALKHHPNTWWWLKADGCDVVSGLAESMRGTWSGDDDLNNGDVERQYREYRDCLAEIENMKFSSDHKQLQHQFQSTIDNLKEDLKYLQTGIS